ncbi:MAG: hypothetical protein QOJ50_507, partial [Cryptosporangiaceae bacterium]|nr:hypothetical protein [Cryptosporangiaceae bacterium]
MTQTAPKRRPARLRRLEMPELLAAAVGAVPGGTSRPGQEAMAQA